MNSGFADRPLRPLGYDAISTENLTAESRDSNDANPITPVTTRSPHVDYEMTHLYFVPPNGELP